MGLAHALYRETDGNPFFVGEVLRHLSESGAIYQDDNGRWKTDAEPEAMPMPDSVRMVIGSRVARLGESASQVLPLASVIGREFDLDLLARVTGRTEDELLDLLDAAAAATLVREVARFPGRYCFALGFFPASLSLGGLASILGRYDEAEAHFTEATELTTRGKMKFFAARTQLDWGRTLALRGRPGDLDGARAHLEQALGVAVSLGYSGIEQKANTELLNLA